MDGMVWKDDGMYASCMLDAIAPCPGMVLGHPKGRGWYGGGVWQSGNCRGLCWTYASSD